MSLIFFDDARLYSDYAHYDERFVWREPGPRRPLLYHCYWAGPLTGHHELSIKSLAITQSPPFEVWVWMPQEDLARNRELAASLGRCSAVKLKGYVPQVEAEGTAYQRSLALLEGEDKEGPESERRSTNMSNALRLLVTAKYGGVYFDLDVLFLKDLRPLCGHDFFYQWSRQEYGNNAVMHFQQGSPDVHRLIDRSIDLGSCRPFVLLRFEALRDTLDRVRVFPTFAFDPIWITHDTGIPNNAYCNRFVEFFSTERSMRLAEFFPTSYAYHWHGRWNVPIRAGTIIGSLAREVDARFAATVC